MKLLDAIGKIITVANPIAGLVVQGIGAVIDHFDGPEMRAQELNKFANQLEDSAKLIRKATADGIISDEEADAIKEKLRELEQ
jgi:uncharacterized membrane protein YebE (DUF533 family)